MSQGISSSMFKKLTDFLIRRKPGDMTPAEAHRIQKSSYVLNNTEIKKKFSPTYLSILPGLDSDEKQVFEGTAWYLAQIALNKPKYQHHILDAMQDKIAEKGMNPEFRNYLKQQVQNILAKNNS